MLNVHSRASNKINKTPASCVLKVLLPRQAGALFTGKHQAKLHPPAPSFKWPVEARAWHKRNDAGRINRHGCKNRPSAAKANNSSTAREQRDELSWAYVRLASGLQAARCVSALSQARKIKQEAQDVDGSTWSATTYANESYPNECVSLDKLGCADPSD